MSRSSTLARGLAHRVNEPHASAMGVGLGRSTAVGAVSAVSAQNSSAGNLQAGLKFEHRRKQQVVLLVNMEVRVGFELGEPVE